MWPSGVVLLPLIAQGTDYVTLQACQNASRWFLGAGPSAAGTLSIRPTSASCVEVRSPISERSEMDVTQCSDAGEQQFFFVNGSIKHAASGLCIGAEHSRIAVGTKLDINAHDDTANQQWSFNASTGLLQHALSGHCLSSSQPSPAPTPPAPPVPAGPATIRLDVNTVLSLVDDEYVSVAYDTAAWLGIPWEGKGPVTAPDLNNSYLRTVVAHFSPARLRVGGGAGDCLTYAHEPTNSTFLSRYCKGKHYYDYGIRESEFETLADFAKATNVSLIFGLNAGLRKSDGSWDPTDAAKLLSFPSGCNVFAYELGNELGKSKTTNDIYPSPTQYGQDFQILKNLIRSKCASSGRAMPTLAGTDEDPMKTKDVEEFLVAAKGAVGSYTWHHYIASHASIDVITDPANLDGTRKVADGYASVMRKYGVDQWCGETSGASNGGTANVTDRYVDGVWWMDQLGALAQAGVTSQNRQSLLGADYGVLDYNTYEPTPSYFAAIVWKRLMGREVLNASATTNEVSVRAYAHCHQHFRNGTISLLLVNTAKKHVNVSLNQSLGGTARFLLEATSPTSRDVALNGGSSLKLGPDGSLPPALDTYGDWKSASETLTMGPLSYGFVVLLEARAPACTATNIFV